MASYRLCRCCHAETKNEVTKVIFRGLEEICFYEGVQEKYSDMIKDALGIYIKPHLTKKGSYTICRSCINRLIDVVKFKKQVLECEKLFYEKNPDVHAKEEKNLIKLEITDLQDKEILKINEHEKKEKLISSLQSRSGLVIKKVASERTNEEGRSHGNTLINKRKGRNIQQPNEKKLIEISIHPNEVVEVVDTSNTSYDAHKDSQDGVQYDGNGKDTNDDDFFDNTGIGSFDLEDCQEAELSIEPDTPEKNPDEKRFICEYCDYAAETYTMLQNHLGTQTYEINNQFICDICNKAFNRKGTLRYHVITHTDVKPHTCHLCGKGFITKSNLVAHIKYFHEKQRDCVCPICNKTIVTRPDLRKHVRRIHNIEDLSVIPDSLKYVPNVNKKPKDIRRFCCEFCSHTSKTRVLFTRHLKIHSDETPFICDFCDKGFKHKISLRTHMLVHTGEKPNECHICGKRFGIKMTLVKHIKYTHNKEKDYVCPVCSNPISNRTDLKKHLRRKHKIQDLSTINIDECKING